AGPFAKTLISGLKGAGKAKVWALPILDAMLVKYDSLYGFLRDQLRRIQPITHWLRGEDTEGDAILARLKPVPRHRLTVSFRNAQRNLQGTVTWRRSLPIDSRDEAFEQQPVALSLEPGLYWVRVEVPGSAVTPSGDVAVELYDDTTLDFDLGVEL